MGTKEDIVFCPSRVHHERPLEDTPNNQKLLCACLSFCVSVRVSTCICVCRYVCRCMSVCIYAHVYVVIQELVYACMPWAIEAADTRSNCFWEPSARNHARELSYSVFSLRVVARVHLRIRANACRYEKACVPNLPI